MSNYSSKIISSAISALAAQQAMLAATSNNIANVNTPGYARRTVDLVTRNSPEAGVGGQLGAGVDISSVQRIADRFLQGVLERTAGERSSARAQSEFLSRAEQLFRLDGTSPTIGSTLSAFFTAANDLASDPASLELRSNFVERARDLVTSISSTYNNLASLQREADLRLEAEVSSVNRITAEIAALNGQISTVEADGTSTATDFRDQRERLLNELSEKISFSTVELANGSINIQLANGFSLVNGGTSRDLSITQTPSFDSTPPQSLSGEILRYITYNYGDDTTRSDVDFTTMLSQGEGSIAGLLKVRGTVQTGDTSPFNATGPIVQLAGQVEAVTRTLLDSVNRTYLGYDTSLPGNGDEDLGTAGFQSRAGDLNGNAPDIYGLFTFNYSGSRDLNSNGLPDDIAAIVDPNTFTNFSSRLALAFTDPARVAAALDIDTNPGSTSFAPGDARNIQAIANLRNQTYTFSVVEGSGGSFSGRFEEAYNNVISTAGNAARRANTQAESADQKFITVSAKRDEISGVNLDEEFTNLVRFQRAFQASARVLRVADELLEQVVNLL